MFLGGYWRSEYRNKLKSRHCRRQGPPFHADVYFPIDNPRLANIELRHIWSQFLEYSVRVV